jgi:hypothetical protein
MRYDFAASPYPDPPATPKAIASKKLPSLPAHHEKGAKLLYPTKI